MFDTALAARIPIIGVTTDDLANSSACLQLIAGMPTRPWPIIKAEQKNLAPVLYWTDTLEQITVETYRLLMETEHQLIVINPEKRSSLVFDAGVLPTPKSMVTDYLKNFVGADQIPALYAVLKGLSLKAASEIVQLTMVRTGGVLPQDVRHTRAMMGGQVQGLYPVDTTYDFYVMPDRIGKWLSLNEDYFLNPKTPARLMPRGLMLAGGAGVGKSTAAKAIARHFKIPLYRLDISSSMSRYVGETEAHVARSLAAIEQNSPCVLLLDEAEKAFEDSNDQGVTKRVLAQLLWWLAEHRSKVLTIMTTNNLKAIPPELYRPGRLDRVIEIPRLDIVSARTFAIDVFKSVMAKAATAKQVLTLTAAIDSQNLSQMSHAEVSEIVYETIKINGYYPLEVKKALQSIA